MSLSCYRDILLCDLASHAASQSTRSGNISTLSCSGTTERSSGGRLLDTTRDISRLHGDIDLQGRNRPSCDASHIRHQLLQRPALSEFLGGDHQTRTSSSIYVPPELSEAAKQQSRGKAACSRSKLAFGGSLGSGGGLYAGCKLQGFGL